MPIVFCDFDGTVFRRDVGYTMFNHFSQGRNDVLIPDWKSGRLSTRECLLAEAAMVTISEHELEPFLDQFEVDPGFERFVQWCESRDIELIIASDGIDIYIKYLLARHGWSHLPLLANKGVLEKGKLSVTFPFDNAQCERCGNCKGERIREFRRSGRAKGPVLFVGDGFSDLCGAKEADIVFAKKDLELYCQSKKIPYHVYDTFDDVIGKVNKPGFLGMDLPTP